MCWLREADANGLSTTNAAKYSQPALAHGTGMEQSPRFQSLLTEARSELDSARRRAFYGEMQQILRDEGGLLIPVFANHLQAVGEGIATPATVGNLWAMDNARFAERWWRA